METPACTMRLGGTTLYKTVKETDLGVTLNFFVYSNTVQLSRIIIGLRFTMEFYISLWHGIFQQARSSISRLKWHLQKFTQPGKMPLLRKAR